MAAQRPRHAPRLVRATARAWRNGWFHTGDAFRVGTDGNYFFFDRIKDARKVQKHRLRADGVTAGTWDRAAAGIEVKRERIGAPAAPGGARTTP